MTRISLFGAKSTIALIFLSLLGLMSVPAPALAAKSRHLHFRASKCSTVFGVVATMDPAPGSSGLVDALLKRGEVRSLRPDKNDLKHVVRSSELRWAVHRGHAMILAKGLRDKGFADKIRTVLYPGAGFDAGTPFLLFPEADVVIGLEQHSFTHRANARRPRSWQTLEEFEAWVQADKVGGPGGFEYGLKESIVDSLEHLAVQDGKPPRILKVLEIVEDDYRPESGTKYTHGVIEFDHGPGTRVRRYIHIFLPPYVTRHALPGWIEALHETNYDTIFLKASLGLVGRNHYSFGGYLLEEMRQRRGGLIVDTDDFRRIWGSLLRFNEHELGVSFVSLEGALGYAGEAWVHILEKKTPPPLSEEVRAKTAKIIPFKRPQTK